MSAPPRGVELAGRCCRRWPPADVLSVLKRLPYAWRQNCRQPLLQELVTDLRKRAEQSRGFPSASLAQPSSARSEAILSFLEPHLLQEVPDGQQMDWNWAEWRGRVQRWAGWPAPDQRSSPPVSHRAEDRSGDQPPTALWHRFLGRSSAVDKEEAVRPPETESVPAPAADTTDRCELLKRDLIRSLTGLGDMLRRDGSSCSFYSIESDSLQEKSEPSEPTEPTDGRQRRQPPARELELETEPTDGRQRRQPPASELELELETEPTDGRQRPLSLASELEPKLQSLARERELETELSDESARREAQAMMAAGVGRQSSSESEPGCSRLAVRRYSCSDCSDRLGVELVAETGGRRRPARQASAESTDSSLEEQERLCLTVTAPNRPGHMKVTLAARCSFEAAERWPRTPSQQEQQLQLVVAARASCESTDSTGSDATMDTACDQLPSAAGSQRSDEAVHSLTAHNAAWDGRLRRLGELPAPTVSSNETSSSSSESEESDSCERLTARRVEGNQSHKEEMATYTTRDVLESETRNEPEVHANMMTFAACDQRRSFKLKEKETRCSVEEFVFDASNTSSTINDHNIKTHPDKEYDCLLHHKHTASGKGDRHEARTQPVVAIAPAEQRRTESADCQHKPGSQYPPNNSLTTAGDLMTSKAAKPHEVKSGGTCTTATGPPTPPGSPTVSDRSDATFVVVARRDAGGTAHTADESSEYSGSALPPAADDGRRPAPRAAGGIDRAGTESGCHARDAEGLTGQRHAAVGRAVDARHGAVSDNDVVRESRWLNEPVQQPVIYPGHAVIPGHPVITGAGEADFEYSVGADSRDDSVKHTIRRGEAGLRNGEGRADSSHHLKATREETAAAQRSLEVPATSGKGTAAAQRSPEAPPAPGKSPEAPATLGKETAATQRSPEAPVMHTALQTAVFQFHGSKPAPALSNQWDLNEKSCVRTTSSKESLNASENTQCYSQDVDGVWSSPCDKELTTNLSQEEISLEEMLSDVVDSYVLVVDDDEDVDFSPTERVGGEVPVLSSSPSPSLDSKVPVLISPSPSVGSRVPVLNSPPLSVGVAAPVLSSPSSSVSGEVSVLSSPSPSRIPRRCLPGRQPPSPSKLPILDRTYTVSVMGGRGPVSPETPLLPRTARLEATTGVRVRPPAAGSRGIMPSKPTVASVLRGQTIRQGLAVAGATVDDSSVRGGLTRSRSMCRAGRPPPVAGLGRYLTIHAGAGRRSQLPSPASSVPTLLPTALHQFNGNSYGGSDQLDRATFRAPSKLSNYNFSADAHSESSDEDPNGITLSNTTRSKLKLLTKRNEMRKGLERTTQQEPAAAPHHEVPGHSHHDRDERARKFRQLEKDLSSVSVESRLAARKSGQLAIKPVAVNGGPSLSSPRRSQPTDGRRVRRAISHERPPHVSRPPAPPPPPHGQKQLSSPDKLTHILPSPGIERKSGSMQNLATHKPKQPPLPKSKTFGAELNRRSAASSASSVFGDHLEPFASPKQALEEANRKLNSDDWEREVSGLTDLVRLFRHHPETISSDLKAVMASVVKQMKNLRSQVLRAALQTSAELFQHVGKATEPNIDKMVAILLLKTSDTNKFIKADSQRALDLMIENVSVTRSIVTITSEGLAHRNGQVRATVARLLASLVRRLGAAGSLSGQKDITERLVPAAAQLARDSDLQTRIHAKEMFHVWLQYPELDKVLGKYLSSTVKRDIDKVVDNIRNEVPLPAMVSASLTFTS